LISKILKIYRKILKTYRMRVKSGQLDPS